ncbi:DUF2817 domain-containing protein [Verticiella sediminum]|uniref:DUF2817 domain-containing protein n=1 Tax=Verticiella sediminum TaxID=1247510 RepID=A0A556AMW9_9BURK|nr:DUF2817 domain-containing protein [Verticiella sediminum]TSH94215.1 DUF2817 domain-containing protein [Verticiella sediminum]
MTDSYPSSYADARNRFLDAAQAAGAALFSQVLPGYEGPSAEALALDAAYLGAPRASRVLVMLSGTHGSEGYAASPLLSRFMSSGRARELPDDVAVLLVHAVNPYGFAHTLRTNENNVDLNRNFIDFAAGMPANPGYREVHALLCPEDPSEIGRTAAKAALAAWVSERGTTAYFNAVFNGQYEYPRGLMYGGGERQWSNLALEAVARRFLTQAERIAFIDWHTGLGEYGEPFFLCFNTPRGPEWERCCAWWGRDAVETKAGFDGAPRPQYSGLVFHGLRGFCAQAEFAGAVIEFGTTPPEATIEGLQVDNRLRFDTGLSERERTELRQRAMESFCPSSPEWRERALRAGLRIADEALDGLRAWQPAA